MGLTVQLSVAFDLVSVEEINYFNETDESGDKPTTQPPTTQQSSTEAGDDPPTTLSSTTQPPTTQRSSTEPSEDPTTTTAPQNEPLKCETCSVDKIGPYAIKAGEGGCKKTRIRFFTRKYENLLQGCPRFRTLGL